MKTKITIDLRTDNIDGGQLNIQYRRKDLEKPANQDEEAIIRYIMGVIRACIDNGFAPTNTLNKGADNGETVGKQEEVVSCQNVLA